jgi:hypothetical protein
VLFLLLDNLHIFNRMKLKFFKSKERPMNLLLRDRWDGEVEENAGGYGEDQADEGGQLARVDWALPALAPRPFRQLAARDYRLGLDLPVGYMGSLTGKAWYRPRRRRARPSLVQWPRPVPCRWCGGHAPKSLMAPPFCIDCVQAILHGEDQVRYQRYASQAGV